MSEKEGRKESGKGRKGKKEGRPFPFRLNGFSVSVLPAFCFVSVSVLFLPAFSRPSGRRF
jgi:hypothetical protein